MSNSPIRVIAFDDNKDLRDMFRMLVDAQPDMVCVAVHPDLSQLMRDLDAAKPDVIVMDIQMPGPGSETGVTGIWGVRAIKARWPDARILMQTVFEDEEKVFDAIRAGASGYILKTSSGDEMMKAIRDVHAGGSAMTPAIAFKVLEHFRVSAPPSEARPMDPGLSEREKSVLTLLVKGRSYKMIADELGISYHTVDSHIRRIYEKLHVSNGTEAVSKAIRDRLV
ncbi:MAG: response regulator transcription factor [Flavobacteriales bacterium]|nr:response regulator transcription factor [Flavobacteriales bacterium]MCC6938380.1 response regulator transcription factor [Flavobacteriales bacterium]